MATEMAEVTQDIDLKKGLKIGQQQTEVQIVTHGDGDVEEGAIVLNTTDGAPLQTVQVVSSAEDNTEGGETSYVLVVSQGGSDGVQSGTEAGSQSSVYEFGESSAQGAAADIKFIKKVTVPVPAQEVIDPSKPMYMCTFCSFMSPKRYLLHKHAKEHATKQTFQCEICKREFKTKSGFKGHLDMHHGVKDHKCSHCPSRFTTANELSRHVKYKHLCEKPHKCTECDYSATELSKLKRHMRCHTGEKPYQCPHCTYASTDTFKLKRHLRTHTGEKPYVCNICGNAFSQCNSLKTHKLTHETNRPTFQCDLCPAKLGRPVDLRHHMTKMHMSDIPLPCTKCGEQFPDRYTLKVHLKVHDGQKCFKCTLCAYAATNKHILASHMLTHTDTKPYECDACGQGFRVKSLLKRHIKFNHDPEYIHVPEEAPTSKEFECSTCRKSFKLKSTLLRHIAVVHTLQVGSMAEDEQKPNVHMMMAQHQMGEDVGDEGMEIVQNISYTRTEHMDDNAGRVIVISMANAEVANEAAEVQEVTEAGGSVDNALLVSNSGPSGGPSGDLDGEVVSSVEVMVTTNEDGEDVIIDPVARAKAIQVAEQIRKKEDTKMKTKDDIETCFGFEDEEGEEEEDEENGNAVD